MTPIVGHIYKCVWDSYNDYTYYNVITDKHHSNCTVYCVFVEHTSSGRIIPRASKYLGTYNFNVPNAQITDLGPLEAFKQSNPEYFI